MTTQEYAISLPFRISLSGSVESTTDQGQIWSDRVTTVLGTAFSERVQRYYFGSKIHQEVFMTEGEASTGVSDEIGITFANYLPLLRLGSVDTEFNSSEGTLNVRVNYRLPNNAYQSTNLGTIVLNGNFPAQES
jgi:hypothetical protein